MKGNEITGVPGESFSEEVHGTPGSVAVDQAGDIYAVDLNYDSKTKSTELGQAVVEFSPKVCFCVRLRVKVLLVLGRIIKVLVVN